MLKLKAPLIIAGATCVLSMLIGLISGVRFLSILGRGLIAGVGAGVFVVCARIILERFIPDLFVQPAPTDTAYTADISSGSNINITLDDGITPPAAAAGNTEPAEISKTADLHNEGQTVESSYVDAQSGTLNKSDVRKDEDTEFSDSDPLSFGDDPQGNTGLSDLPDMGSFMDDNDDFNENSDSNVQTDTGGFSMTGIQTDGTDSKVMAQAIRTVLATED